MRHSWVIFRYIAMHYALWLAIFLAALVGIVMLFETAELLRRAAGKAGATLGIVLQMGFYKLPETIDKTLPFIVLFAALYCFWRMTKSQELVIVRAAGVSVWEFMLPVVTVTLAFAYFNITLLNPISANMIAKYRQMEAVYLIRAPVLELTGAGLWLRQNQDDREYLLHADRVEMNPLRLLPSMTLIYGPDRQYLGRIDAEMAELRDGQWYITNPQFNMEGQEAVVAPEFTIATELTFDKIQDSLAAPNTISFWELPKFIQALRAIGLPALRHQLQLNSLWAQPWLLCAMTLFAAAFALRLTRLGNVATLILAGIGVGTAVFSLNSILIALGATESLPVLLSAWAAPIIGLMCGAAALLYLEDG